MTDLFAQIQDYEKHQAQKFPTSGTIAGIDGGFVDVTPHGSTSILRNVRIIGTPTSAGQSVVLTWENGTPTAHLQGATSAPNNIAILRGPAGPQGPMGVGSVGPQGPQGVPGSLDAPSPVEITQLSSTPANPPAGKMSFYPKTDMKFYALRPDGVEAELGAAGREVLKANRTYYVATTGNNGNNGLTVGAPFLTIQKAIDIVTALDLSLYTATIQVADGTYTGTVRITTPFVGGSVVLQGNSGTPANVVISVTGNDAIKISGPITVTVKDLKITTTVSGALGHGIVVENGATLNYSNVNFGAIGLDGIAVTNGNVQCIGNYSITGSCRRHFSLFGGVIRIQSFTITLTGTPNFSSRFIHLLGPGMAFLDGNTFSGSATGVRYFVGDNAAIYTASAGENYLPGNAAGIKSRGGRYDGDAAIKYVNVIATNVVLGTATVPASSTSYAYPGVATLGGVSGTIWPVGGTLKNMYVRLSGVQPASGSLVITLQKNLVDTALTITFAAGAGPSATGYDITHTVSIVAGDILTWKIVNNATATSGALSTFSMSLEMETT